MSAERLSKLLKRPRYLPRPTREEIVAEALAELHRKLLPFRRRKARAPEVSP